MGILGPIIIVALILLVVGIVCCRKRCRKNDDKATKEDADAPEMIPLPNAKEYPTQQL